MRKPKNRNREELTRRVPRTALSRRSAILVAAACVIGVLGFAFFRAKKPLSPATTSRLPEVTTTPKKTNQVASISLHAAEAVMVTAELDFGPSIPSVVEALLEIERRYEPKEGSGRTFAVIEAFGEPDRGKLRLSMRVSTEKEGQGSLVFRRTGEVLWRGDIGPPLPEKAAAANEPRNLTVLMDIGVGRSVTIDGSNNPGSILQANVKELSAPVSSVWPEGAEVEFSFLYSACGCPVKALVTRVGDRTVRAKELPVLFPDDPAVAALIHKLMRW